MRTPAHAFVVLLGVGLAPLACLPLDNTGSSSGSASSSGAAPVDGGEAGTTTAGIACQDMATAFATAAQRCGGNYAAERTAFISDFANGDCNSVSIRNEAELRSGCIPSFSVIACDAFSNQRFDPTCAEQLIRSK
jgi:hypothetical protein